MITFRDFGSILRVEAYANLVAAEPGCNIISITGASLGWAIWFRYETEEQLEILDKKYQHRYLNR